MQNFLNELNDQQAEAVRATHGPVLVLAGAGSGKTKTLTHRLAYLVDQKLAAPHEILAVTFTNKSAEELRNRAAKLLNANPKTWQTWSGFGSGPVLGTFHSICARILRQDAGRLGYDNNFVIFDTEDQKRAIKHVMLNAGLGSRDANPNTILGMISRAKNELLTPGEFSGQARGPFEKMATRLYRDYQDYLKKQQAMDFDDLLMQTVVLLQKFPEILASYEKRWPFIMIDEYQDTNHAQYTWARLLARNNKNIFVVGDDWQGIYSWRGATIRNILEFEKDYPGAKTILLEQNYRSNEAIVQLGNNIIAGNTGQMKKKLWANKPATNLPEVWQVTDEVREAEFVLEKIAELEGVVPRATPDKLADKKSSAKDEDIVYDYAAEGGGSILDKIMKGFSRQQQNPNKPFEFSRSSLPLNLGQKPIKWNKYAVLYRTNAQSRAIEEVLLRFSVPYRLIGGIRFYERKEIKDTLAYLRFLLNPNDIVSLDRIINEPARGIGERTLSKIINQAQKNETTVLDIMAHPEKIDDLSLARQADVKSFAQAFLVAGKNLDDLTISEVIDLILKRVGYIDYLQSEGETGADKLENIAELKTVARKFIRLKGREAILAFLEEIALVSDLDTYDPSKAEALTLMTLHSAKGLEFDTVFLVGIEEGLLPHANSILEPAQIEEERRLCYVGITRARNNLYLLYTRTRRLFGKTIMATPSRFLAELGEDKVLYFNEDM